MAWIKIDHCTPDKPEVIGIAEALGIDQDAAFGKLCRLWIWADQQTRDGNAGGNGVSVTRSFIDRCTCAPGFASAMERVGWLGVSEGKMSFPNFERHNGETAKQRALTSKRVEKHRGKSNAVGNDPVVTSALPDGDGERRLLRNLPVDGTGDSVDVDGTGRDGFLDVDWEEVRREARNKFAGIPMKAAQDKSLGMKTVALVHSGRIPRAWFESAIESTKNPKQPLKKPPAAYFTAAMKNTCKNGGLDFLQLLATQKIPAEVLDRNGDGR